MRKSAVVLVALVAAVMSPAAFAENGSFETGDFSGWAVDVPSVDAAVMPGGAPGGGSYFGAVGAGSQEHWHSISTSVSLQAGDAVSAAALFSTTQRTTARSASTTTWPKSWRCSTGMWSSRSSPQTPAPRPVRASAHGAAVRCTSHKTGSIRWWRRSRTSETPPSRAGCGSTLSRPARRGRRTAPPTAPRAPMGRSSRRARSSTSGLASRPGIRATPGATLARLVEGKRLTCDTPPAGFVQKRLAGDAQHVPDCLYAYVTVAYVDVAVGCRPERRHATIRLLRAATRSAARRPASAPCPSDPPPARAR